MATPARRRPAVRRPAARTSRQTRNQLIGVATIIGLFATVAAIRWINAHRGISIAAGVVLTLAGLYWAARTITARVRAYRNRWSVPTSIAAYMNAGPEQFEHQTAALCKRDGATRVRVVGGAGDLAADVLATTPGGDKILIQCKRYATHNKVGSEHVQRVNGTYRDIHGCDQAAIVTTSSYTIDATRLARRVGIRLYDADDLAHWARGGQPPWR